MKLIAVFVLLLAVGILLWRWLLPVQEKAQTGVWVRRAGWSFLLASTIVFGAFGVASLTSWRLW